MLVFLVFFLVLSGRAKGGPVKERLCGVLVFLVFVFLVFSGRTRGGPVKKEVCVVLVFLVCCAINSNLDRINNVYSHILHHTC